MKKSRSFHSSVDQTPSKNPLHVPILGALQARATPTKGCLLERRMRLSCKPDFYSFKRLLHPYPTPSNLFPAPAKDIPNRRTCDKKWRMRAYGSRNFCSFRALLYPYPTPSNLFPAPASDIPNRRTSANKSRTRA